MFPWLRTDSVLHEERHTLLANQYDDLKDAELWRGKDPSLTEETSLLSTSKNTSSSRLSFVVLPALEERVLHEILEEQDARKHPGKIIDKRGGALTMDLPQKRLDAIRPFLCQHPEEVSVYYPPGPSRGLLTALIGITEEEDEKDQAGMGSLGRNHKDRKTHAKRFRDQGEEEDTVEGSTVRAPRRALGALQLSSGSFGNAESGRAEAAPKAWCAPSMFFTEGFQPVDYMGRLFVTPHPSAIQRASLRYREPCYPPRAPKRVFQAGIRGDMEKAGEEERKGKGEVAGMGPTGTPSTGSSSSPRTSSGIQMLRWAPPSFGHLFFSADLQGVTRLWRCHQSEWGGGSGNEEERRGGGGGAAGALLATYKAHQKPVKSLYVTKDATRMTSGSTDGTIAMWDVETGTCLHHLCTFPSTGTAISQAGNASRSGISAFPPVVDHLHHPSDEPHLILAAVDRKVVLYDVRTSSQKLYNDAETSGGADGSGGYCSYFKPQREYQGHMGTILHLSLLGSTGSKLLTTSEDKTLRTWDYTIPIQIKQFADAGMHAISHVIPHPRQEECLVAQSLNNKILLFEDEGGGRIKLCPNREYSGHKIAGTRCQLAFSHDGVYLSSGDSTGQLFIWKWDKMGPTGKLVKKFKAHQGMLTTHLWHPMEPSRIITGGWDGSIKEWI